MEGFFLLQILVIAYFVRFVKKKLLKGVQDLSLIDSLFEPIEYDRDPKELEDSQDCDLRHMRSILLRLQDYVFLRLCSIAQLVAKSNSHFQVKE